MTKETVSWLKQSVKLISKIVEVYKYSDDFVKMPKPSDLKSFSEVEKDKFLEVAFFASCSYISLVHELNELISMVNTLVRYFEFCDDYDDV